MEQNYEEISTGLIDTKTETRWLGFLNFMSRSWEFVPQNDEKTKYGTFSHFK